MALSTVRDVIFEKSGRNRNERPSPALGMNSECTQKAMRITNSSGISMLLTFSMPFSTPRARMA